MLFAEVLYIVCRGYTCCLQRLYLLFAEVIRVVCRGSAC